MGIETVAEQPKLLTDALHQHYLVLSPDKNWKLVELGPHEALPKIKVG